jgi:homoserine trans-succinylase
MFRRAAPNREGEYWPHRDSDNKIRVRWDGAATTIHTYHVGYIEVLPDKERP